MIERRRMRVDIPYQTILRVCIDLMVVAWVAVLGVWALAVAQGTVPAPTATEFPWVQVLQGVATALTAIIAYLVRNQVKELHLTINSKMDRLLSVTAQAAKAEGVLEGRQVAVAAQALKDAGVAEGKASAVDPR